MFRRIGILLFLYLVVSPVLTGYLIFFTALPVDYALNHLSPNQLQATGVSGSLFKGISIDKITFSTADGSYRFVQTGVRFAYSSVSEIFSQGRFVLEQFTVDKMETKVSAAAFKSLKDKVNPFGSPSSEAVAAAAPEPVSTLDPNSKEAKILAALSRAVERAFFGADPYIKTVGFHEFRVSNSVLEYVPSEGAPTEVLKMNQMRIGDLLVHPYLKSASLGEYFFSDDKREFGVHGLSFVNSEPKIESIQGKVKVAYDPDHVRQEIDFSLKVEGGSLKDLQKLKISLNALGGKVRATVGPEMAFFASFFDVTMRDIYVAPFPISHLNLEVSAQNLMMLMSGGVVSAKGDFKIAETLFRFNQAGLQASAMVGKTLFTVQMDPARLAGGRPSLLLRSTQSESSQDNLSYLYFQSAYAALDDVKKMQVDTDLSYFDRATAPAGNRALAKAAPAPIQKKLERYPASEHLREKASRKKAVKKTAPHGRR